MEVLIFQLQVIKENDCDLNLALDFQFLFFASIVLFKFHINLFRNYGRLASGLHKSRTALFDQGKELSVHECSCLILL